MKEMKDLKDTDLEKFEENLDIKDQYNVQETNEIKQKEKIKLY